MALGAIQAIEDAGKKPGTDIVVVSVDGVKSAFEAIVAGKMNCTVECSPLLGPSVFDAVDKALKGETLPKKNRHARRHHDDTTAKDALPSRY